MEKIERSYDKKQRRIEKEMKKEYKEYVISFSLAKHEEELRKTKQKEEEELRNQILSGNMPEPFTKNILILVNHLRMSI